MRRPLIIGQAPSAGRDHEEPLTGKSGRRLAGLCGLSLDEFRARFERVNVLDRWPGKLGKGDAFPADLAREGALAIMRTDLMHDRRVVLLGCRVADAFSLDRLEPLAWHEAGIVAEDFAIALCPHPSGLNHWWNDPAHVEAAALFWRALADQAARASGPNADRSSAR